MYSVCMFCNRTLGQNEVIETFPIGRRLAFDPDKGRLWVVCRKCERWNLTPMEERWEAIEDCERLFRDTRVRSSTDNVGLCRLTEGLELVRIGRPMRPEFAAWRYGDQFGRRRRKTILYGAAGATVVGAIAIGGIVTGAISGALLGQSGNFINLWVNGRTRLKLRMDDGRVVKLKLPDLTKTKLSLDGPLDDWSLEIYKGKQLHAYEAGEAKRIAGLVMPALNRAGGGKRVVQEAVSQIEESGDPESFLRRATRPGPTGRGVWIPKKDKGTLAMLPTPTRLAVEMALHEEQERRALQGELRALEIAWREAEEIAEISDNLLLPEGTDAFLDRHRQGDPEAD